MSVRKACGDSLAAILVAAMREGNRLSAAALPVPETMADAMAAQAELCAMLGGVVQGWKTGITPDGPVAAPLLSVENAPVRTHRIDCVEVELAFRLSDDLPRRAEPYSRAEIVERIGAVHIGIELLSLRFNEGLKAPLHLLLVDRIMNGGYIVSAELSMSTIESWRAAQYPLTVNRNGVSIFDGTAKHQNEDPLSPLVAYANQQNDQLGGLRSGHLITTGHLCGLLDVSPGDGFHVVFNGAECRFAIGL